MADAMNAIQNLIKTILGGDEAAVMAVAGDTTAAVAATGYDGTNGLTVGDLHQYVGECMAELEQSLSAEMQQAAQAYVEGTAAALTPPPSYTPPASSGGGGGGAVGGVPQPSSPDTSLSLDVLRQELQYITASVHENNPTVINEIYQDITNVDNSVSQNFEVDGDFLGDVTTATGGGVAAGGDIELEGGQLNTGDGAVQVDGTVQGGVATGEGAVATGRESSNVVGDGNTAIQATDGSNIDNVSVVSGDVGGDVVSIGDVDDASLAFGDGAQSSNVSDVDSDGGDVNIGQTTGDGVTQVDTDDSAAASGGGNAAADIQDSAIGQGSGDTSNISDLDDGSAASMGGDADGSNLDIDDSFNDNEGVQNTELGDGSQTVEQEDLEVDG